MPFLTKEQIKNHKSVRKIERVNVPEWDGHVFVTEISSHARDVMDDNTFEVDPNTGKMRLRPLHNQRALFVVLTACDVDGKAIFDLDDVGWLGEKQFTALERIYKASMKLNGLSIEDAEKNSEAPAGDSPSD